MNVRWALSLPMWTFIALLVLAVRVQAQGYGPAGPAAFSPETPAMGGGYAGPPMGMEYGGPAMAGGPMDMGMGYGGYGGDEYCPPGQDGPYRGLLGDFFGLVGPYADGGVCAPRYFDISVDAMWLQRDGERNINLVSDGIAGNAVLSTDQFRFDERPSFRFIGWIPFKSMGNLEFNYFGLFHHADQVQVNDPGNNLFSALSQFGTVPFGGFLEEGNAAYARMELSSQFDNFEFNYRRHWQGADCRLQGSWLMGARYFKFDENFDLVTVSTLNAGQLRYSVDVDISVVGAQTGGDAWVCIVPGMRAGVEGKAGVYGNHASQGTRITATTLAVPYTEEAGSDDVAFVGDLSFYLTYRINYQLNLKLGYTMLYADGLALGAENFNATPPNVFFAGSDRTATLNDNGSILYTGGSIGVEYNW